MRIIQETVSETSKSGFDNRVNKLLKDGFEFRGDAVIILAPGEHKGLVDVTYIQVMVRKTV